MNGLDEFVRQSNAIEGIFRTAYSDEIVAHEELLALPELTVLDVETFVWTVAVAKPRFAEGLDVRVGDHIAPRGGPAILDALTSLLGRINNAEINSWGAHVEYETLHPFTDGNGRSGRAIWLWMWIRAGNSLPPLSFLQQFYYQTLSESRS